MGICLSVKIKAQSFFQTAESCTDGHNLNSSRSKSLVASVPSTPRSEGEILQSSNLKVFTFADLKMSSRNFHPDRLLGEGDFGSVYKGWVDENSYAAANSPTGIAIAIKRLNQDGFHGHCEWLAQVHFLGKLHHPNLVKLIGYCLEDEYRLLVYEFLTRWSLENHLFRRSPSFQPLSWNHRLKVALGAAKGLAFLHDEAEMICRDFKTSNILLDSDYNAKLSDSGLVKDWESGGESDEGIAIYDNIAPEYLATGHFTTRSNVYSFGVVLLEMLTGRRAVDRNRPSSEHSLVKWVKPYLSNKRKVFRIIDTHLEGQYTMSMAHKMARLALRCLSSDPKFRPTMGEVVKKLEQLQNSKENKTGYNDPNSVTRPQRRNDGDVGVGIAGAV